MFIFCIAVPKVATIIQNTKLNRNSCLALSLNKHNSWHKGSISIAVTSLLPSERNICIPPQHRKLPPSISLALLHKCPMRICFSTYIWPMKNNISCLAGPPEIIAWLPKSLCSPQPLARQTMVATECLKLTATSHFGGTFHCKCHEEFVANQSTQIFPPVRYLF